MKTNFLLLVLTLMGNYCLAQTVEDELKEVDSNFCFHGYPLHPLIIYKFLDDGENPRVNKMVNLSAIPESSRLYRNVKKYKRVVLPSRDTFPPRESFKLRYIGKTDNGIHVVWTSYNGGGSGSEAFLLFFVFKIQKGEDGEPDKLLMQLKKSFYNDEKANGDYGILTTNVSIKHNKVWVRMLDVIQRGSGNDPGIYKEWYKIISFEPNKPKANK